MTGAVIRLDGRKDRYSFCFGTRSFLRRPKFLDQQPVQTERHALDDIGAQFELTLKECAGPQLFVLETAGEYLVDHELVQIVFAAMNDELHKAQVFRPFDYGLAKQPL